MTGAEDYMVKPFVSRELVARVSLQVQLGKRRRILEKAFAQRLEEVERRRQQAEQERKRQELLIDVTSYVTWLDLSYAKLMIDFLLVMNYETPRGKIKHFRSAKKHLIVTVIFPSARFNNVPS